MHVCVCVCKDASGGLGERLHRLPQRRGPFPWADIWTGHLEAWWGVARVPTVCVLTGRGSAAGSLLVCRVLLACGLGGVCVCVW